MEEVCLIKGMIGKRSNSYIADKVKDRKERFEYLSSNECKKLLGYCKSKIKQSILNS